MDIKDATDAHKADPFVIVTDSINKTWDASECKGIKSIYSIRGSKGQTKTGVYVNTYVYIHVHVHI